MDTVHVHHTVDEIDRDQWDCIAGASIFLSVGWLRTVETHYKGGLVPYYFSLWNEDRLIGTAVCYRFESSDEIETPDDIWFGRAKRLMRPLGVSFLPALACCTAFGNSHALVVADELGGAREREAVDQLISAMESAADEQGLRLSFLHVLDGDHRLRGALERRGYLSAQDVPFAVMDIGWESYDGYLDHLPKKQRKEFRRQGNRNRDSATRIETLIDVTGSEIDLERLADLNSIKHNGRPFAFRQGFFGAVKRNLGEAAQVYCANRDESTTGLCLTLGTRTDIFIALIGVDRSQGEDFTYFEICYRFPIAVAAARNVERVHYGRSMYEVKRRRGCRFVGATNYCTPQGWRRYPAMIWLAALSTWNGRILRGLASPPPENRDPA